MERNEHDLQADNRNTNRGERRHRSDRPHAAVVVGWLVLAGVVMSHPRRNCEAQLICRYVSWIALAIYGMSITLAAHAAIALWSN